MKEEAVGEGEVTRGFGGEVKGTGVPLERCIPW